MCAEAMMVPACSPVLLHLVHRRASCCSSIFSSDVASSCTQTGDKRRWETLGDESLMMGGIFLRTFQVRTFGRFVGGLVP